MTVMKKQLLFGTILLLLTAAVDPARAQADVAAAPEVKIDVSYDSEKDRTTVRLAPIKLGGDRGKYHSIHMSPYFSYPVRVYVKPQIIDFELQTVVKGRLSTDLYVVFLIDGEKIFLSSNRRGIKRPVPGRVWMGESLVFRMPYETLLKLVHAKQAAVKLDAITFEFDYAHKRALKIFAETHPQ